ncbi:WASH complex subunit 3 [Ostrinia nubilalis]|uniref:WASH complex subunit 3 n=1 Tax=Ostrinia nubilalis TaxID=29057 RepID=UPI0030826148
MQETMIQKDLTKLDLSKVAALQQKRTLAFVNHFAITTVQFLNNFMKNCEQKLMHFERKLEKVEAAMVLLEARLSSIPEVNSVKEVEKPPEDSSSDSKPEPSPETQETEQSPPQTRPEYDRFIKMVQVGVPLQAVKLKVSMEGLDPDIFEQIINK